MTICAIVSNLSTTPKQVVMVNAWRNTNFIIKNFLDREAIKNFLDREAKSLVIFKKNSIRNSGKIALIPKLLGFSILRPESPGIYVK